VPACASNQAPIGGVVAEVKPKCGILIAKHWFMRRAEPITLSWMAFAAVFIGCSSTVNMEPSGAEGGAAGSVAAQDGGASAGVAPATAGNGAGGSRAIPVCQSPISDASSQLVVCANGFAHRARPSVCVPEPSAGSGGAATEDGQSTAGASGASSYGAACSDDTECASGTACVCNPAAYLSDTSLIRDGKGACVLATCRTDADCDAGSYCAVGSLKFLGEASPGFGCLRTDDECTTDADCNSRSGYICLEESRRTCSLPPQ